MLEAFSYAVRGGGVFPHTGNGMSFCRYHGAEKVKRNVTAEQ